MRNETFFYSLGTTELLRTSQSTVIGGVRRNSNITIYRYANFCDEMKTILRRLISDT